MAANAVPTTLIHYCCLQEEKANASIPAAVHPLKPSKVRLAAEWQHLVSPQSVWTSQGMLNIRVPSVKLSDTFHA